MKKLLLSALLAVPLGAFAAPPAAPEFGPGSERHEMMQKQARMRLTLGIAEALDLSEAEALKVGEKLRSFEDRRRPIQKEMHDSMMVLKKAAEGDSASLPQVDAAISRVLDARAKMAAIDKETFTALAKDFSPQKRARLALFFAHSRGGGPGPGMGGMGMGPGGPGTGKGGHRMMGPGGGGPWGPPSE